jgi:hypothetical protein
MRNIIITLFLVIGSQSAIAASVTARASATILEPVKISFQAETSDYAAIDTADKLHIESAHDIHYDLSRNAGDVCLFAAQDGQGAEPRLALASCETYTVNFN